jgi:glutamine amidotransferase
MTIAIVDYGMGNLYSIYNALNRVDAKAKIVSDPASIEDFDGIVIPGVGAFGRCMDRLSRFEDALSKAQSEGKPILGICIGLQVLFEESEESPGARGLGWIKGKVVLLPADVMIPQMGWNSLSIKRPVEILGEIAQGDMFYFVHSYYGNPVDRTVIAATTDHGVDLAAVVAKDNLFATQFHPEKSGEKGLKILENFVRLTRC